MEYPEKIVTWASKVLLNLFFDSNTALPCDGVDHIGLSTGLAGQIQERFITLSNSMKQVVRLLASASREIQKSMVDLLVMLSAFKCGINFQCVDLWSRTQVHRSAVSPCSADTRQMLVGQHAPARLTRILKDPENTPEILESAIKSISNLAIEGTCHSLPHLGPAGIPSHVHA